MDRLIRSARAVAVCCGFMMENLHANFTASITLEVIEIADAPGHLLHQQEMTYEQSFTDPAPRPLPSSRDASIWQPGRWRIAST